LNGVFDAVSPIRSDTCSKMLLFPQTKVAHSHQPRQELLTLLSLVERLIPKESCWNMRHHVNRLSVLRFDKCTNQPVLFTRQSKRKVRRLHHLSLMADHAAHPWVERAHPLRSAPMTPPQKLRAIKLGSKKQRDIIPAVVRSDAIYQTMVRR
jgi:hypothetical protein